MHSRVAPDHTASSKMSSSKREPSKKHKKRTTSSLRQSTKASSSSSASRTVTITHNAVSKPFAIDASLSTRALVRLCAKEFAISLPLSELCVKVLGEDASGQPIDGLLDDSMTMHDTDTQLAAEGVVCRYVLQHDPLLASNSQSSAQNTNNNSDEEEDEDHNDNGADDHHGGGADASDDDDDGGGSSAVTPLNLSDNATSVPSFVSPRMLKSDTLRLEAREKQRRRRANHSPQGSHIRKPDDADDSAAATEDDEKRESKNAAWARFEDRLQAALADENDSLRNDFFKARGADLELSTHRRRPRLPDGELIGDIKRKDAALALNVDVFKRDWEMLQFNNRVVTEQLADANEIATPLPFADLRSWLEPIKPISPRSSVKDAELHKDLVSDRGKWMTAVVESDRTQPFLSSFTDASLPAGGLQSLNSSNIVSSSSRSAKHRHSESGSGASKNTTRNTQAFSVPRLQPLLVTNNTSRAMRVLVEPIDLRFELPPIEPLFCQLQLYNLRERRRLSEVHYLHVEYNSTMLDMVSASNSATAAPETRLQKAIFTVDEPSADIYLVLRVFCVLRPDEDPHEPYYGSNKQIKTKEMTALVTKANDYCVRFGAYMQPFAFGAVPLLNDAGELSTEPVQIENMQPMKSTMDSLLERMYQESGAKKKSSLATLLSKDKTLNGRFTLKMSALTSRDAAALRGRLSPSLIPLKPLGEADTDHRTMRATTAAIPFLREVQQLPSDVEQLSVHDEFVNNLYINLESLNLTTLPSATNKMSIVVQMELKTDDADVNARGEKVIYGRACEPLLVSRIDSTVAYNSKKPVLVDEFKVRLPTYLGPKHNLYFTFFNLTVKKSGDVTRTPVAYAFLPLIDAHGKLLFDGQHHMLVYDAIHSTYMSQTPKSFDKRPLFSVSTFLLSSIRGTSDSLHRFLHGYSLFSGEGSRTATHELMTSLSSLRTAPVHEVVRHHPTLLNQLIAIMCDARHSDVSREAFNAFMYVVDAVASATTGVASVAGEHDSRTGRNATLDSFTHHFFSPPETPRNTVHSTLVKRMADTSRTHEAQHIQLELYGWFIFDLIVKSTAMRIGNASLADDLNRAARLAAENEKGALLDDLKDMVEAVARQVKNNIDIQEESTQLLNRALAFFLLDLLSLLDRGSVFALIHLYFATLDAHSRYLPLVRLKVTCLRVFNQYEHYLVVNLAVPIAFGRRSRDLLTRFWKQHFLVGLQLAEVRQCLDYRQKEIRLLSGNALLEQLAYIDSAFQPPRRQRIVDMFFPYVPLLLERAEFVKSLVGRRAGAVAAFGGGEVDTAAPAASTALATAAAATASGEPEHLRELRAWLAAWLFVCRDCTPSLLRDYFLAEPAVTRARFFEILSLCVTSFQGCHLDVVREVARVALIAVDVQLQPNVGVREPDAGVEGAFNVLILLLKVNAYDAESLSLVFVAVRQFIHQFRELLFLSSSDCLSYCAGLCFELLGLCDSVEPGVRNKAAALLYVLMRANWRATQQTNFYRTRMQTLVAVSKLTSRGAIEDYTRINSALSAVSARALEEFPPAQRAAGSPAPAARDVRAMSFATSLESKRQTSSSPGPPGSDEGSSVSSGIALTGPMLPLGDDESLSFGEQVELLVMRMFAVIRDNQNIALNRDDPEITTDLYYQVASNYTEMPVLRVTWLDNLAAHHVSLANHAEAAQCKLYIAYLVALHLVEQNRGPLGGVPTSAESFRLTAPNLRREQGNPKLKYQEGMYDSPTFSQSGLIRTLTLAIEYLKHAEMYEAAIDVHSILVTMYRDRVDYAALQKAFAAMSQVCGSLVQLTRSGRFFSCYYRVGFYGKKFGAFDRKQFVYKEKFDVKSGDITERLRVQFGRKFGDANVEILPNKPVDTKKLDKKKCYLQLATLTPFEAGSPPVNVARFMLQVPFTKESSGGKERTHGGVASQYIRRTIYTCEGTFPWINKRLFIAEAEEVELTPVQNAVELIQNQTRDLRTVAMTVPPNRQALQMLLQGSVTPQVHGGTLEVAEAFFGKHASSSTDKADLSKLASQLGEFLHECRSAIELNRRTAQDLAPPPAAPIGGGQMTAPSTPQAPSTPGVDAGNGSNISPDKSDAPATPLPARLTGSQAHSSTHSSPVDVRAVLHESKFQAQVESSFNTLVSKFTSLLPSDVKLPAPLEVASGGNSDTPSRTGSVGNQSQSQ